MKQAFAMLLAVVLTGCGETAENPPARAPETAPAIAADSPSGARSTASTASAAKGARTVSAETNTYSFAYAYPEKAGAIPGLARLLDARLERTKADLAAQASKDWSEAEESGYPFRPHANDTE